MVKTVNFMLFIFTTIKFNTLLGLHYQLSLGHQCLPGTFFCFQAILSRAVPKSLLVSSLCLIASEERHASKPALFLPLLNSTLYLPQLGIRRKSKFAVGYQIISRIIDY